MAKTVSINKLDDENVKEIGIQVRNDINVSTEERVETNGESLRAFLNGQNKILSLGVYTSDPSDLSQNQVWINDTEGMLKWSEGGNIYQLQIPDQNSFTSISNSEQLLARLEKLEDKFSKTIPLQGTIADSFDRIDDKAVIDNSLRVKDDSIVVRDYETSGSYIKTKKQSNPANNVEGLLTFESGSYKPTSVTNNNDGTHTVVLSGVLTDFFKAGKKLFVIEQRKQIINQYDSENNAGLGVGEKYGKNYNISDKKAYPMLDSDLKPVIVSVDSFSHNGTDTTLELSTGTHDLESVNNIHFIAKPFTVSAGVSGSGGTLDELEIEELMSIDKKPLKHTEGVIGHDIMTEIYSNAKFGKCQHIVFKCSPNRKYWLILANYNQLTGSSRLHVWYSSDGLNSIQHHREKTLAFENDPQTSSATLNTKMFNSAGWTTMLSEEHVDVNDDGRYYFTRQYWDSNYTRWNAGFAFGRISEEFKLVEPLWGATNSYAKNQIAFENNGTHSYFISNSAIDWDSSIVAIVVSRNNDDAYIQWWYLDYDKYDGNTSGMFGYDGYVTTDYHHHHNACVIFWKNFEGEKMLFMALKHTNQNYYALKYSRERIIQQWKETYNKDVQGAPNLTVQNGSYGYAFCATGDYEDGDIDASGSFIHEVGTGTTVMNWEFADDDTLMMHVTDDNDNYMSLTLLDFGRTSSGKLFEYDLDFNNTPDLGGHAVNKIEFDNVPTDGNMTIEIQSPTHGNTSKAFYNPNSNALNNAHGLTLDFINSIPWLEEKELEITGDAENGFEFHWKHLPEDITIVTTTNTLILGADAQANNLMTNGGILSFTHGPTAWGELFDWNRLNNGVYNDWVARTGSNPTSLNLNRGVTLTFNSSTALKRLKLYWSGLFGATELTVQYFDGSIWQIEKQFPIGDADRITGPNSLTQLTFNQTGANSATQWRVYVSGWDESQITNMYLYEIEAFDIITTTPVVETHSKSTTGVPSQGGSLELLVDYVKKDSSNKKVVVSNTTSTFTAGQTAEAITNIISSNSLLGSYSNKNDTRQYHENKPIHRANRKEVLSMFRSSMYNDHGRFNGNANDEMFEIYVDVRKSMDYQVKAEIVANDDTTVLWSSDAVYNQGQHTIQVDFTKFEIGSVLYVTTYTEKDEDYKYASFTSKYKFNTWNCDSSGGVWVTGNWTDGFKIKGRSLKDIRFKISSNSLVETSLTPVDPTVTEVVQGNGQTFLKYDNDTRGPESGHTDDTYHWKKQKTVPAKFQANIELVGGLNDRKDVCRLMSGSTTSMDVNDVVELNNDGNLKRHVTEIIDGTDFRVSPSHSQSVTVSNVPMKTYEPSSLVSDRNHDGQTYRLRGNSITSKHMLGKDASASEMSWRRMHVHKTGPYSMMYAQDMLWMEYARDVSSAMLFKIPDIREFKGTQFSNTSGTGSEKYIQSKIVPRADGGTRFAQKIVIPDLGYGNDLFPLRTLGLYLRKNWSNDGSTNYKGPTNWSKPNAHVKVSIIGLAGGFPDESNVIAESTTKVPLLSIPMNSDGTSDSRKVIPFIFDNVQLTPASEICIMVEVVGLDVESLQHDSFILNIGGNNTDTSSLFKNIDNVWTPVAETMWTVFYDHYMIVPSWNHESGPNYRVDTVGGAMSRGNTPKQTAELTLGKIENNNFYSTYQYNGYYVDNDADSYSPWRGGAKTYGFIVDNENIPNDNHPPILKDPEMIGVREGNVVDENLVWAHAFGYTPDGQKGLYLKENSGIPESYDEEGFNASNGDLDNYRYNGSSHYGGHQIGYDGNGFNRLGKYTPSYNENAGRILEDEEFLYGRCVKFSRQGGLYTYYRASDMTPYMRDFIWECEWKPTELDCRGNVNGGSNTRMIFGLNNAWYVGVYSPNQDASDARYHVYNYNNWLGGSVSSVQTVPADTYHRFRITKSYTEGVQLWRNFTKDDEGAWELMDIDPAYSHSPDTETEENGATPRYYSEGREWGNPPSLSYNYYSIGRWTNNTSHHFDGSLGYMKMAFNTTQFAYNGLNFDEPEIIGVRNLGTHMLAFKKQDSGRSYAYQRTSARPVIIRPSHLLDSRTDSNEYVVKFNQYLSEGGRESTVKIDIEREDFKDPAKVKGYLIDFNRK